MSERRGKTIQKRRRKQKCGAGRILLTGLLLLAVSGGIWLLQGMHGPEQETEQSDTDLQSVQEAEQNDTELQPLQAAEHVDADMPSDQKTGRTDTDTSPSQDSGETEMSMVSAEKLLEEEVEAHLADMTTEEKVLQLFMITPEALTGAASVTAAGDRTREAILQYPVGGIIYFAGNLKEPEQVHSMLENTRSYYEEADFVAPFLGVDEEGGRVARIGGQPAFGVEHIGDMCSIGDRRDAQEARRVGNVIGTYLSELGFSLDFAPVADVLTDPDNQVIGRRSYGTDPELVAELSMETAEGLEEAGVWAVLKHYPGHGATREDSHDGYAYTDKTLEELLEAELIPFRRGIEEGIHFIMAAHISVPSVTGDQIPCTLSPYMITDVLRGRMGYDGIVVTDAMNMGAIRQQYSSGEASVLAIQAGVDLILMPADFHSAFEGVLDALEAGTLTEERIDESVRRILRVKLLPQD